MCRRRYTEKRRGDADTATAGGRKKAFTLIELLVVIAIISLLVSILLPSLNQAKELARGAVCLSGLRQIGIGLAYYASEQGDYLPPWISNPSPPGFPFGHYFGVPGDRYASWYHLLSYYMGFEREEYTAGVDVLECPSVPEPWKSMSFPVNGYGYNFRFGGSGPEMHVQAGRLAKIDEFANASGLIIFCDAGYIDARRYFTLDPEEWAPMTNNPGHGEVAFPGDGNWFRYPGGNPPTGRPVPMARHAEQVGCMFLDSHAQLIAPPAILEPVAGESNCLFDKE